MNFYKIGMELVYGDAGLALARALVAQNRDVITAAPNPREAAAEIIRETENAG